jgi:hypothetical protein
MWPERVIHSKMPTVGPDPHGKVLDPCKRSPDLRVGSRTSLRGIQATLSWVPGLRDREYLGLAQARAWCRRVSRPSLVWTHPRNATTPHPDGDPMLPCGLSLVT